MVSLPEDGSIAYCLNVVLHSNENREWKNRMNRELEEMSKGEDSKMDKRAKDELVTSPRENGGG